MDNKGKCNKADCFPIVFRRIDRDVDAAGPRCNPVDAAQIDTSVEVVVDKGNGPAKIGE
ncbi:hypothetical protein [Sideroxydans lithotrophicus]|uniref:hypothetical protein n=1 Tax=Sideroxydans lithotrophicus TaxID=63745 RepID=UPI00167F7EF2|nr:hypothetical protein [Sideroxydans lithotrophicus]